MLLTSLLGIALSQAQVPMKWTGQVKALAIYCHEDCLPNERVGTVYAARKVFEDGSSATLIRTVGMDRHPAVRLLGEAQGLIERDPKGTATRVAVQEITDPLHRFELREDPQKKGILAGKTSTKWGERDQSVPSGQYPIDPIEALTFEPQTLGNGRWTMPVWINHTRNFVSLAQYTLAPRPSLTLDLAGRRETFRTVSIVRSSMAPDFVRGTQDLKGLLLFRANGNLAANLPRMTHESSPSRIWFSGLATKGLAEYAESLSGKNHISLPSDFRSVFMPVDISATERTTLLNGIEDRKKPKASDKDDGS